MEKESSHGIRIGICIGAGILGLIAVLILYILLSLTFSFLTRVSFSSTYQLFSSLIVEPSIFFLAGLVSGYILVRGNIDRRSLFLPLLWSTPGLPINIFLVVLMLLFRRGGYVKVDYVTLPYCRTKLQDCG